MLTVQLTAKLLDTSLYADMIEQMKQTARAFKALADENRLRILALLLEGELCVNDLMSALQLPQSTVSRHLAYLKNSGWIDDRRGGVWVYYSLVTTGNDFQNGMIYFLRRSLAGLATVQKDRERLMDRKRK